jgi:hypothetical protein
MTVWGCLNGVPSVKGSLSMLMSEDRVGGHSPRQLCRCVDKFGVIEASCGSHLHSPQDKFRADNNENARNYPSMTHKSCALLLSSPSSQIVQKLPSGDGSNHFISLLSCSLHSFFATERIFRLESLKGIKQKSHLLNRKAIASALIDSNAFFLSLFIQKIFPEELKKNFLM